MAVPKAYKSNIVVSAKGLLGAVMAIVGLMSAIAIVHTTFVLPSVMEEARDMTEERSKVILSLLTQSLLAAWSSRQ